MVEAASFHNGAMAADVFCCTKVVCSFSWIISQRYFVGRQEKSFDDRDRGTVKEIKHIYICTTWILSRGRTQLALISTKPLQDRNA